ncbi:MAG: hypothetical protein V4598_07585 [Bdellovibrionota bacterium]
MKFFILLLTLIPAVTFASSDACKKDAERLCGGIDPGKNQIFLCLKNYESELTSACKQEMKSFQQKTAAKNPCYADLADFCADVDPSKSEYCLLKNESRLSATCSRDFKNKKGNLIVKNQCALDIVNTCYKEVSGGEGSINKCLIRNKTKLSRYCQNNVTNIEKKMRATNACFDDQEKFCPAQVKFVETHDCLHKKLTTLSPACKKIVMAEQDRMNANPCYKDLLTHCEPGLTPNQQVRCLEINDKHLNNACRQYRAVMDNRVNKMVNACEADRKKLCPKAPMKDGMVLKCLREKKAQVSAACKNLI